MKSMQKLLSSQYTALVGLNDSEYTLFMWPNTPETLWSTPEVVPEIAVIFGPKTVA